MVRKILSSNVTHKLVDKQNKGSNICSNGVEQALLQPNIYGDPEIKEQEYVLFWNDAPFSHGVIESVICTLEDVRLSGSYTSVKIMFSSAGGYASQLMMIVDYLNNYPLPIKFIVNSMSASCGSLILLMVESAEVEFLPTSSVLFHYAHMHIHSSGLYGQPESRDYETFGFEDLKRLNTYIDDNYYSKLTLTQEELEHIRNGKDVMLDTERAIQVYDTFKERSFFEKSVGKIKEGISARRDELLRELEDVEILDKQLSADEEDFMAEFKLTRDKKSGLYVPKLKYKAKVRKPKDI
ncbi:MAG: ATP-dependent Clp protease proteolytic subunit [Cetobacterium sp.]